MQTYRRHLNAAASRDFITPGNLITIPRLLRMDDHAARRVPRLQGQKKWPSYRPQKLDPHAVPPTVGGTARGSSFWPVSRSRFWDRTFYACVELATACCAWRTTRLWHTLRPSCCTYTMCCTAPSLQASLREPHVQMAQEYTGWRSPKAQGLQVRRRWPVTADYRQTRAMNSVPHICASSTCVQRLM